MTYDAIVLGGGFAGLSAAMQLARARRRILLVDAGAPRNRFARAAHGFLGQDGVAPADLFRTGLRQLSAYPSVDFLAGTAVAAQGAIDDFTIALEGGEAVHGRRLILATGVRDLLPDIPGLAERWGESVLHCPYCHGYELAGGPIGVLAGSHAPAQHAALLADWGPVTLFGDGDFAAEDRALLDARGVTVERTPIAALHGPGRGLAAARLEDGREIPLAGLFVPPRTAISPLAAMLGCATEDGMTGAHLAVDALKQTNVPGVFAAGDTATAMHNGTLAAAAGVMAGVATHRSLVFPDG